jgi:hypothetical protein
MWINFKRFVWPGTQKSNQACTSKLTFNSRLPSSSQSSKRQRRILPVEQFRVRDSHFNKGEFRNALNIRYSRPIKDLPTACPCGVPFTVQHAMDCKNGGFDSNRHNEVRDFEATVLSEVCKDVSIEPPFTTIDK